MNSSWFAATPSSAQPTSFQMSARSTRNTPRRSAISENTIAPPIMRTITIPAGGMWPPCIARRPTTGSDAKQI